MKTFYLLLALFFCLISVNVVGQTAKRLSGIVSDTSKVAIKDALVEVILEKDTLRTTTDEKGNFSFSRVKSDQFILTITSFGYQGFTSNYRFGEGKVLELPTVMLKRSGQMLNEVFVKAKPNPIRIMQDTVEHNIAAYQVFEGDNVADLLKQFPGMEVDADYNVKTMGQEITKLRVNGKDFFTNNVKDFISKLPGLIVDKIQIIDDYGDDANFTGIKTGEPTKMLNIVTKQGMNKGKFGDLSVNGGTNDRIGSKVGLNIWSDTRQSGGNVNYGTQNNGAGTAENMNVGANFRDKMGKNGTMSANYRFGRNSSAFSSEQAVETASALGAIYNQSQSNGENDNNSHNGSWDFSFRNNKTYFNGNASISYGNNSSLNSSVNNQNGIIKQDLRNQNSSAGRSPQANIGLSLSRKLKNSRNSFSANFNMSVSDNRSVQNIITNTLYYNKTTGELAKDSLLDRRLENVGNNNSFNGGFRYGFGLKKLKDTLANHSLNLNYGLSVSMSSNQISTFVESNLTHLSVFIDSLSTETKTMTLSQSLGLSYNYGNKKNRLNLGLNARPQLQQSNYLNLDRKITNNAFNYSPTISFGKTISKSKTLSINYSGNNSNPTPYQLQPIKNTQNLQNIVVGNPNLKPTFNHGLTTNYNYVHTKSGMSAMVGLRGSMVQNEIVNNVLFVRDTLNSFKQETRFENVNGTYNLNGNYNISLPIKKNKISVSYNGNLGYANRAVFINNERKSNQGVNLSQGISGSVVLKKLTLNGNFGYSLSTNNNYVIQNDFDNVSFNLGQFAGTTFLKTQTYRAGINSTLRLKKFYFSSNVNYNQSANNSSSIADNFRRISSISLSFSGNTTIRKTYRIGFNGSKVINTGYSLATRNPLFLSANLSKSFFKTRALSLNISANDLLNQGNNISRSIVGNSVIDRRTNQITRVVSFGLSYNLSKFGGSGQTFQVYSDEFQY